MNSPVPSSPVLLIPAPSRRRRSFLDGVLTEEEQRIQNIVVGIFSGILFGALAIAIALPILAYSLKITLQILNP